MDKKQKQILQVRNRVMQDRKVLCTGNPNRKGTIASGVREVWMGSDSYKKNKLELRDKSLELNSFRLQTCHIVMGGVDTGIEESQNWVKPKKIAEMIKWVTEQDTIKIPIIGIDQPKQPW